jgi:TRAP-type C4-dicarboxylate transport system substrate-binding protein
MEDVKFRSYNAATARMAELMDAAPVQIEAAELSQALATGVAESFISSGSTGYDSKVWEQLTHWYEVNAWLPRNHILVNKQGWEGLDDASRQALLDCAAEAEARGTAKSEELNGWYKEQLMANGMTVTPAGDELRADLEAIGATMTEEWLAIAGDDGKAVIDTYQGM